MVARAARRRTERMRMRRLRVCVVDVAARAAERGARACGCFTEGEPLLQVGDVEGSRAIAYAIRHTKNGEQACVCDTRDRRPIAQQPVRRSGRPAIGLNGADRTNTHVRRGWNQRPVLVEALSEERPQLGIQRLKRQSNVLRKFV